MKTLYHKSRHLETEFTHIAVRQCNGDGVRLVRGFGVRRRQQYVHHFVYLFLTGMARRSQCFFDFIRFVFKNRNIAVGNCNNRGRTRLAQDKRSFGIYVHKYNLYTADIR